MRIRATKPEFWRSRRIASVEWEARFVLKGLESYVDDNGVGKDDHELIVSDLFSRDLAREPSRTLKRVQVAVDSLFEAGLVHRYAVDGTDYLFIAWWDSTQYINRPSKGRFPRPDGTFEYGESEIGMALKSPQEPSSNFSAGTGEQGNRGTVSTSKIAGAIVDEQRPEIEALCERLAAAIEANGSARPSITKGWRDAARLMLDKDARTVEQVQWIIDWCQRDEFWRANVLSMPTLRRQFDKMRLRAVPESSAKPKHDPDWALA
jgi:hypothetical protein